MNSNHAATMHKTLCALVASHEDDPRFVTAYPLQPVKVLDGEASHCALTGEVFLPAGFHKPNVADACAVQFADESGGSAFVMPTVKRTGMICAVATDYAMNWNAEDQGGCWLTFTLFSTGKDSRDRIMELFHRNQQEGFYQSVSGSRESHEVKNSYGEVVGMVYGPSTFTAELTSARRRWLRKVAVELRNVDGFYKSIEMSTSVGDLKTILQSTTLDALEKSAAFIEIVNKFGGVPVMDRLSERFVELAKAEAEAEQARIAEAFVRSMQRRRRIVLE